MSNAVLVVGGSGFLGTVLVKELASDAALTIYSTSTTHDDHQHRVIKLDILRDDVTQVTKDFDTIINLTGQITHPIDLCEKLNSEGIARLVESAQKNHQRLIHASTTLVYGAAHEVNESSPLHPESPYATAKVGAEEVVRRGLPEEQHLILLFSNIYGPDQTKGLFWYLIDTIKRDSPINFSDNDGSLKRHYMHCDDVASIIHQFLKTNLGGTYNVAGPDVLTIKELVAICEALLDKSLPTHYADIAPISNIDRINTDKLQQLVSVHWKHSVREFLRDALV